MQKKEKQLARLQSMARSLSGQALIAWIEDIVDTYADVRNATGVGYEVRKDAVNIIENELLTPLRGWAKENKATLSGDEME